jgi:hypothetical protein
MTNTSVLQTKGHRHLIFLTFIYGAIVVIIVTVTTVAFQKSRSLKLPLLVAIQWSDVFLIDTKLPSSGRRNKKLACSTFSTD